MKSSKRVSNQPLEGANVGFRTSATRSRSEPDAVTIHSEGAAYPLLPPTSTTKSKFCLIHHRSILHHGPVQSPSSAFSVDHQLCLIPRVREVEFVTKQLVIDLGVNRTQSAGNWNRKYIAASDLLLRRFLNRGSYFPS
jgi:hypothetical protein